VAKLIWENGAADGSSIRLSSGESVGGGRAARAAEREMVFGEESYLQSAQQQVAEVDVEFAAWTILSHSITPRADTANRVDLRLFADRQSMRFEERRLSLILLRHPICLNGSGAGLSAMRLGMARGRPSRQGQLWRTGGKDMCLLMRSSLF